MGEDHDVEDECAVSSGDYGKVSAFEHRFWLQVLGDHARFIYHTLSPDETNLIQQARVFMDVFDQLTEQARHIGMSAHGQWMELAQHATEQAERIRQFKLHIIALHLDCNVNIGLSPTFINHMVNEVEEYLRVLCFLSQGEIPPQVHPVHHHLVWLLDAAGHASAITAEMDMIEKETIKKAEQFQHTFEDFYIKAEEMAGFFRARTDLFPALQQFNHDSSVQIILFYEFLRELEEMRLDCRRLGTLMPLMADHMAREECYYLMKLGEIDPHNVERTECDPTKPRVESRVEH